MTSELELVKTAVPKVGFEEVDCSKEYTASAGGDIAFNEVILLGGGGSRLFVAANGFPKLSIKVNGSLQEVTLNKSLN